MSRFRAGRKSSRINRLNAAARIALRDENVRKRLLELGAELPSEQDQTPQALAQLVKSEIDKWVPIIKSAGVDVQ
jgi:tripartite-type tricarboxylate transporter receptor subunit TctC